MKLFLLLILFAAGGCSSYSSRIEAELACKKWSKRGEVINTQKESPGSYESPDVCDKPGLDAFSRHQCRTFVMGANSNLEYSRLYHSIPTRSCQHEKATRQYLGYEIDQSGIRGKSLPEGYEFNSRIKKRFRY